MRKFIILLSSLILLLLVTTSKPLIPVMKTLFMNVTGTVPDAEEIARKAELFRRQTEITPFIVILPDINNEASLRRNGKAILAHASSLLSNVKGNVLPLFTTHEPRLIMITNGQVEGGLDDRRLGLLIENHTLAYLNADLWCQGIDDALAVLQTRMLKQPTPPLTYCPHPGQQHENAPPDNTNTLGFVAWTATFILFSWTFCYTTHFIYALRFTVAMTIANMGCQALCLYIDSSFTITGISPLWVELVGVCTFIAALLLTSKQ